MFITIAGFKGGSGKTTTAIHLASYFSETSTTLLIDGDSNNSAQKWAEIAEREGHPFPFAVCSKEEGPYMVRDYETIIIDTQGSIDQNSFKSLAKGCDYFVIPSNPEHLSLNATFQAVQFLDELDTGVDYRVLITQAPPRPNRDGWKARQALIKAKIPVFDSIIPRYQCFADATGQGVIVRDVLKNKRKPETADKGWIAYQRVAKELVEHLNAEPDRDYKA
ncbi:MAG: ParA family protein [Cyanobacteria bacterium P01_F01_bin.116]